jgi:hypothetical protein
MIRGEISNHAMFVHHKPSGILLSQAEGTLQRHDRSSPASQSVGGVVLREPMFMSIATRLRGRWYVLMPISWRFQSVLRG